MPIEELLKEIVEQRKIIVDSLNEIDNLVKQIKNADAEQYDWISTKKASEILDVSVTVIYNKINNGTLEVKHIASKKFVRKSQVYELDDKYQGTDK